MSYYGPPGAPTASAMSAVPAHVWNRARFAGAAPALGMGAVGPAFPAWAGQSLGGVAAPAAGFAGRGAATGMQTRGATYVPGRRFGGSHSRRHRKSRKSRKSRKTHRRHR